MKLETGKAKNSSCGRVMYDASFVASHFSYIDGALIWKNKPSKTSPCVIGSEAGTVFGKNKKYRTVHFLGKKILAHHIVWAIHHGEWVDEIDHINGDSLDNRIYNLRIATRSENCMNKGARSDSGTGVKGVTGRVMADGSMSFMAMAYFDGRSKSLGTFKSVKDAMNARDTWASIAHGKFFSNKSNTRNAQEPTT